MNGDVKPPVEAGKQTGKADKPMLDLARTEFERMMDDSVEDVLRLNRDRLKQALIDPMTPANALPAISKQLIAICDRLNKMSGDDNLFDLDNVEVMEDAGASII